MDRLWLNLYPENSLKRWRKVKSRHVQTTLPVNGAPFKPFPFMSLPLEIRLHILSFTDLTTENPDKDSDGDVEIRMDEDRLRVRRPFASTVADGLLFTSKSLRASATEIMMTGNRLVLHDCSCTSPDPKRMMLCLEFMTPQILRRVSALCIRFNPACLLNYVGEERHLNFLDHWIELIEFVASNFLLKQLSLTIDVSWEYDTLAENGITAIRSDMYHALYVTLAKPLISLRGLRRFSIFLSCNCELEDEVQAMVMGCGGAHLQEECEPLFSGTLFANSVRHS